MPKRASPFGSAALVDAKEVAVFLGCSVKHVRRLAEQGRLPLPVKVGRLYRWSRQSIENWLDQQEGGRNAAH